jgi:hypothetical protein
MEDIIHHSMIQMAAAAAAAAVELTQIIVADKPAETVTQTLILQVIQFIVEPVILVVKKQTKSCVKLNQVQCYEKSHSLRNGFYFLSKKLP